MANFREQVNDLTGFSSTDDTALADWLNAGAKELINVFPYKLKMECSTLTNLYIGNTDTVMDLDASGEILHVTRENADSGYHTPCREINAMYGDLASDSTDLINYATATDPVYWTGSDSGGDPKLFVKPTPTSLQPSKIYHVKFPVIAVTDSAIINFPDEADYLIVLYAACKALHRKLNDKSSNLPTFISPVAPAVPDSPSFTTPDVASTIITNIGTPPTYTSPTVTGDATSLTSTLDDLSTDQLGVDDEFIQFDMWFTALGEMIEDDEDIELASAQIEKINAYIQAYNIQMQDSLNKFNKEGVEYQAKLQEALQQAQINAQEAQNEANLKLQKETQEYSSKLKRYQAEVATYGAELNKVVQEFTLNLQKHTADYTWLQGQYVQLKADYQQGLQFLISGGIPQQQEQRGR